MNVVEKKRRSFGGKIDNFESKVERAFEKKHLKAYLKGYETFTFGRNAVTREPNSFVVQEIWT